MSHEQLPTGSSFVRLVRIGFEQQETEPPLLDFLRTHRIHIGEVKDGKLHVRGIKTEGKEEGKIFSRDITAEEIDQVARWADEKSPQLKENPLFHFNMRGLVPYKSALAHSARSATEPLL